jgi:hypothetical protein
MEWKSSTDKKKYGNVVGEVIHHTLFEDGTITKYDVKFGNRIVKNIPTNRLSVVEQQEHMHSATEPGETESDDDNETEETTTPALDYAKNKSKQPRRKVN